MLVFNFTHNGLKRVWNPQEWCCYQLACVAMCYVFTTLVFCMCREQAAKCLLCGRGGSWPLVCTLEISWVWSERPGGRAGRQVGLQRCTSAIYGSPSERHSGQHGQPPHAEAQSHQSVEPLIQPLLQPHPHPTPQPPPLPAQHACIRASHMYTLGDEG